MSNKQQNPSEAFIGIRRVIEISGFSKSTILRKIGAKEFPSPVIKTSSMARWDLAEVMRWRDQQFRLRAEREQTEQAVA